MIKELRERAARAVTAAQNIRDELKNHQGAWPADKQEAFDRAVKEATDAHTEIQRLEDQQSKTQSLDALRQQYVDPRPGINPTPQQRDGLSISEAFSAYVRVDRMGSFGGKEAVRKWALTQGVDNSDAIVEECVDVHRQAFMAYVRGDMSGLRYFADTQKLVRPQEVHALISSDATLGGFTVPDDFQADVIRAEADMASIRPIARVQPTSRDTLVWPKVAPHATDARRSSGFGGDWKAQAYGTGDGTAIATQNQPTFQQERIPVHSWVPDAVVVSPDLIEDSAVSIETVLRDIIAETKALDEDDEFLTGTGVGRPEGILNAGITTVNSGSATNVTFAGLVDLFIGVPNQYRQRGTFLLNSQTFGNVLKLNTGTGGVYIFPPNTMPTNFFTRPFRFHDGMTGPSSGTFTAGDDVIIFGDWSRYIIAERAGLRILRLIERFAPNVGFLPMARVGGQCVLTQAFRIQRIGA